MRKVIGSIFALLFSASLLSAQQIVTLVTYPAVDTGWSCTGVCAPVGIIGSGLYYLPTISGTNSLYQHALGSNVEHQTYEGVNLQANGNTSFLQLTFSVPSTTSYTIAVAMQGIIGTNGFYPSTYFEIDSSAANVCKYPNNHSITPTPNIPANNGGYGIVEYATLCSVTLSSGTHTLGINFLGGSNTGGTLDVRHVVIFPTSATIEAECACQASNGNWVNDGIVGRGTDLFTLATACKNGLGIRCGSPAPTMYIDLWFGGVNSSGCLGQHGSGTHQPLNCKMEQID